MAIFAAAQRSTYAICLETLAIGFEALRVLAATEIPSVGHQDGILHLDAGLATFLFDAHLGTSVEARALLSLAFGVAIARVHDVPGFLQAHPLLVPSCIALVLGRIAIPQVYVVGGVGTLL